MGTGVAVSTGDWITAAKMNLKLEDARDLTALGILDQSGAGTEELLIAVSENLTADRTLTLTVNNADRTIDLSGNLVLGGTLTTVTGAITLTAPGGGSSVTLPASGTLATLLGTEQLENKTLASGTLTGTFTCTTSIVNFTTGRVTFTTGYISISGAGYVSIGANPASAGYFRISNAQYLVTRNAGNDADVNMIQVSANNFVKLGTASVEIATANVVTLTFSNPAATRTITFADPGGADSVAYLAATQTLTGKTINGATLSGTMAGTPTFSGATITFTGNLMNFTAGGAYTFGTTDAQTLILKTGGATRWTWAAASAGVTLAGAADIQMQNTTAAALRITNVAGTLIFGFDSRITTDNTIVATLTAPAPTFVSANGSTYNVMKHTTISVTLTGGVIVTAMSGLQLYLDAPTLVGGQATTVSLASTLYVAAPVQGANITLSAGYSAHFASAIRVDGNLVMNNAAYDLVVKADTAAAFEVYDATTKIVTINSQVTTDTIVAMTITGPAATVASAAGSTYSTVSIAARTHTFSGNTGINAMNGLQLNLAAPTISGTVVVALASTLYVAAPVAAGGGSYTASYSGHFASAVRIDGNLSLASAANDIVVIANTAACLEIYDSTTKLLTINDQTGADTVAAFTFTGAPTSFAAAAGSTYNAVKIAVHTATLTGATTPVTAMSGLGLYIDTPTVTNAGTATAITLASTLYVAAPVAAGVPVTFTAGYSAHFASQIRIDGNISLAAAAYDIVAKANTAAALEISDGTTKLLTFDTRNTVTAVVAIAMTASAPTVASAAGDTFSVVSVPAVTSTWTGTDTITALNGLALNIAQPIATNVSAGLTTTTASTVYIAGAPSATGNMTITNAYALHVAAGTTQLQATNVAGTLTMTSALINFTVGGAATIGTTDANTLAFKTGGTTRFTIAAATATITAAAAAILACPAATANTLKITDGTVAMIAFDSRVANDNVVTRLYTSPAPTFVSAAGSTWNAGKSAAITVTLTGGVGVTAMDGLQRYFDTPTLAADGATTVTTASTIYIKPPAVGANMTITNRYMINTSVAGCFLTAAGVWTDASSRQGKTAIAELDIRRVPKLLDAVKVVSFRRKETSDGGIERFGLIAEDAPDFLADVSHKGISAGHMAGFGLAAIKWLQKENAGLKAELKNLSKQVAALQAA